ncbi:trypsin alpha [Drosophila gunungcola]|uniref:trypsin alpha n=1 Tax=Drosophila gunungcola TaxID=103775 RepID=UPI0022E0F1CE|nr:trypsin alpha [Drosophila gunungcola]
MLLEGLLLVLSTSQILSEPMLNDLPISIGKVPWQASVQVHGIHRCGGVVYSEDIILTIARCVRKVGVTMISVRAGSALRILGGQIRKVKQVRKQLLGLRSSDVAILQLSSPLELGGDVKAIELSNELPSPGAKATVSGWGQLNVLIPTESEILLKVNLIVQEPLKCTAISALTGRLIDVDEFCAAPWGVIPLACQGFVGGPLVSDQKLIGIVSWRNTCGYLNKPSVFANIPVLKLWIQSTVQLMKAFQIG